MELLPHLVVKTKTNAARQALRQAYGLHPGEMSEIEKGLIQAVAILIQAVEASVKEAPYVSTLTVPDIATPEEMSSLESLYEIVREAADTSQTTFTISFPDMDLALEDIWPNGDAPDNPTPEDVIEVMKETKYAHPMTVAKEWELIETLSVRRYADKNGDMEVEWDGT